MKLCRRNPAVRRFQQVLTCRHHEPARHNSESSLVILGEGYVSHVGAGSL